MTIDYLIASEDGRKIAAGQFENSDRRAVARFAERAKQAWVDGHAVITRAVQQMQ